MILEHIEYWHIITLKSQLKSIIYQSDSRSHVEDCVQPQKCIHMIKLGFIVLIIYFNKSYCYFHFSPSEQAQYICTC